MKIQGLEISSLKNCNVPLLMCQLCEKQIRGDGMIFYNKKKGIVAHKVCMNGSKNNRTKYPCCEELRSFFYDLLHNTKIKLKNSVRL